MEQSELDAVRELADLMVRDEDTLAGSRQHQSAEARVRLEGIEHPGGAVGRLW